MSFMKYIGAHVSTAGGVFNAPLEAKKIDATAFAFFTKNQRRWISKPYTLDDIHKFKTNLKNSGIRPANVLAHCSYLINLGNPDANCRKISLGAFVDEINRCKSLGLDKLNFHPGSHLGLISEKSSLDYVADSINQAHSLSDGVTLVIENTAGQGSNLGYKFEHLAYLINKVKDKSRVGVCVDTCHLFASGYDFREKNSTQRYGISLAVS